MDGRSTRSVSTRQAARLIAMVIGATVAVGVACGVGNRARADVVLTPATATSSGTMTVFGEPVSVASPSGYTNEYGTQVTGSAVVVGPGGGAILDTWATVSHDLGATRNLSMAWRTRTLHESFWSEPGGDPTQPPLQMNYLYFGMASDVMELSGFAPGEKFVIQMHYVMVPGAFDEETNRAEAAIHVSWLNPNLDGGTWENAVYGNIGAREPGALWNFDGSWAASGHNTQLGSWGVDIVNDVAWAVIDHNSQFSVAPEPSTFAMLGTAAACIGLAVRRRRR